MKTQSTDIPLGIGRHLEADPIVRRQGQIEALGPILVQLGNTTADWTSDAVDGTAFARSGAPRKTFAAPIADASLMRSVRQDSTPIEVWEGTVIEVNPAEGVMQVQLEAKIGQMPRHTAEIELNSVSPQDHDLVRPGAVFYLTVYKRTVPSVENIQELRFRRRPSWSTAQLKQIERDASMFLSKLRALPAAI